MLHFTTRERERERDKEREKERDFVDDVERKKECGIMQTNRLTEA